MRLSRILPALVALAVVTDTPAAAQDMGLRFEMFPAGKPFTGKPAAVDLKSHKDAANFRTRLREAAAKGANFAGHMTVVTWGCGTECQMIALIDARNGSVAFGPTASAGVKHRLESRLLIVNPPETMREAYAGRKPPEGVTTEYYLWEHSRLMKLR